MTVGSQDVSHPPPRPLTFRGSGACMLVCCLALGGSGLFHSGSENPQEASCSQALGAEGTRHSPCPPKEEHRLA